MNFYKYFLFIAASMSVSLVNAQELEHQKIRCLLVGDGTGESHFVKSESVRFEYFATERPYLVAESNGNVVFGQWLDAPIRSPYPLYLRESDMASLPQPTTKIGAVIQFSSHALISPLPFQGQNYFVAENTSNFSRDLSFLNPSGIPKPMKVFFSKVGDREWEYHLLSPGSYFANYQGGHTVEGTVILDQGRLVFNENGHLVRHEKSRPLVNEEDLNRQNDPQILNPGDAMPFYYYIRWVDASPQILNNYQFGLAFHVPDQAAGSPGENLCETQIVSAPSTEVDLLQPDGRPYGSLISFKIVGRNILHGIYSNGDIQPLFLLRTADGPSVCE